MFSLTNLHLFLTKLMMYFENLRSSTLAVGATDDLQIWLGEPLWLLLHSPSRPGLLPKSSPLFVSKLQNFLESQIAKTLKLHRKIYHGKTIHEVESNSELRSEQAVNSKSSLKSETEATSFCSSGQDSRVCSLLKETVKSNLFLPQEEDLSSIDNFVDQLLILSLNGTSGPSQSSNLFHEVCVFTQKLFEYLFQEEQFSRGVQYMRAKWEYQRNFLDLLTQATHAVFDFQLPRNPSKETKSNAPKLAGEALAREARVDTAHLQNSIRELKAQFLKNIFDKRTEKLIKLFWALMTFLSNLLRRSHEFLSLPVHLKKPGPGLATLLESLSGLTLQKECPLLSVQACKILSDFSKFSGQDRPASVRKGANC